MSHLVARTLGSIAFAALAGCATPPPQQLDLSLNRPTANGRYLVTLQPPAQTPAINQLHSWQVKLATAAGEPVARAQIGVDGGMPQHGHGLPTRPRVTRELTPGTYLLEGMKFSMTGWWELKLAIEATEGADRVTFNRMVAAPGAAN